MTGSTERPLPEIRLWLSKQKPSSWLPTVDLDEERQSMVPNNLLPWQKMDV